MSTKRRLPRLTTGQKDLDAGFLAWVEAMEIAGNWSAAAPLNVRQGPAGIQLWMEGDGKSYAKLSGSGSPYHFVEQYRKADHTWADLPGGRTGDDAYEYNGVAGLSGQVVELGLLDDGTYGFQMIRYGCPWTFTVRGGCANELKSGVVINLSQGGPTLYSGTTNGSGVVTISASAGTYDVQAVPPAGSGYQTSTSSIAHTCGQSTTITLTLNSSDFVCRSGCASACNGVVPSSLFITFSSGIVRPNDTLVWDPAFLAWMGSTPIPPPFAPAGETWVSRVICGSGTGGGFNLQHIRLSPLPLFIDGTLSIVSVTNCSPFQTSTGTDHGEQWNLLG